jgi:hypothetical protein
LLYKGAPDGQVPRYELFAGATVVPLDAFALATNENGQQLAAMNEQHCPSLLLFVVRPDRFEDLGREFNNA